MKLYTYCLLLVALVGLHGCYDEDKLSPTPLEEDRLLELLDMDKPLVRKMKESYGVNLLTRFSDTLDFYFGLYDRGAWNIWNAILIRHLPAEHTDFALEKFDEMVMGYFKNDEFIKRCFPRKILLTKEILGNVTVPDPFVMEPDNREVSSMTAIGTNYVYAFGFDKEIIDVLKPSLLELLRNTKLYCFVSWLYEHNNLYADIPEEFYGLVDGLHREKLANIATREPESPIVEFDGGEYYSVEWYIGKGMALTQNSPVSAVGMAFNQRLKVDESVSFPTKERDFRNFLNVIFCETEANIRTYYLESEVFKRRMRIVLDLLKSYGIDFTGSKPVLKEFYN